MVGTGACLLTRARLVLDSCHADILLRALQAILEVAYMAYTVLIGSCSSTSKV